MRWIDRIRVSLRYIRGRAVESFLVVTATAVGVALVAAMVAFAQAYADQTDALLSHPAYRELMVEVVGHESELTEAAVPFDADTTREIHLGADDLTAAVEATPAIAHAYVADATRFSTVISAAIAGVMRGAGIRGERPGGAPREGTDGTAAGAGRSEPEEFLVVNPDVITELPLETFGGVFATSDLFAAYRLSPASGSLFTDEDVRSGNQVIVLGSKLAETLFPDRDPLGLKVRLNLQTFTIIGILAPSDLRDVDTGIELDAVAFAPNGEAQVSFGGRTMQLQRPTRTLRFAVADSALIETAQTQLQAYFDAVYGQSVVRVTAPVGRVAAERDKLGRILAVVLFLAAAALFIASINLFNLMLMRVIKRTKNIGIARAIGASHREIYRSFLTESGMMSLIGAVIGLMVSPAVYSLLRESLVADAGAPTLASSFYLAIGAIGAFAFSLAFGVWPARQAARVDASLAIRTE